MGVGQLKFLIYACANHLAADREHGHQESKLDVQVLPKRIGKLAAGEAPAFLPPCHGGRVGGLLQSGKCIAGTASIVMAGATTNLASGNILANISLRRIGVQWRSVAGGSFPKAFLLGLEVCRGRGATLLYGRRTAASPRRFCGGSFPRRHSAN